MNQTSHIERTKNEQKKQLVEHPFGCFPPLSFCQKDISVVDNKNVKNFADNSKVISIKDILNKKDDEPFIELF